MPRKGKSNMSDYRDLATTMQQSVGGLTADVYTGFNIGATALEPYWVSSWKGTVSLTDVTTGEGAKHLIVAHSDYSDTEVTEWHQAAQSWDQGDLVAQEQRSRRCRLIGTFDGGEETETLNDGKPIRVKLGWRIDAGDTLQFGLFPTEAMTTGAELVISGKANAWNR